MDRAKLKQRLVGAVVLAAVAVIVIPIVLDFGHDRERWGQGSRVPEPPAEGFVTRILPLEQWREQAESELAEGTAMLDRPPRPPVAPAPAPPTPAQTAKPTAPALVPPAPAPEAWVVQLGSFSNKKNADELRAFLAEQGFRAFVEQGMQGGDPVYRVRVGPERERARADALRERVQRETQLRAIVLRYP